MLRRSLRRALDALGLCLAAVLALVVGVVAHVGTRPGLQTITWAVHAATRDSFKGSLEAQALGSIGPRGVRGLDARVRSPSGQTLAWVSGVDVDLDVLRVVTGAVFGDGPLALPIERLAIDHVALDVSMIDGADGEKTLALADAFLPRVPKPKAKPSPPPTIDLRSVHVHHAWIYGQVAETFAADAEAQDLDASFVTSARGLALRVHELRLTAREVLPKTALAVRVRAHASLPEEGAKDLGADVAGDLGGVPFVARGELGGAAFEAHAEVPTTDAARLTALVPALALRGPLSLRVDARGQLDGAAVATVRGQLGAARLGVEARADLGPDLLGDVTLEAEDVDLTALAPSAPASRLGVRVEARVRAPRGGAPSAELGADLAPGSHVAGQALPPVRVDAKLEPSGRATADVVAAEPGARTTVHAELATRPAVGPLTFATDTELDLAALRRAGPLGAGVGTLTTRGTLDLATRALTARADLAARALDVRGVRASRVDVGVDARGSATAPELHVTLGAAKLRIDDVRALARLDAESDVELSPAILLQNTRIKGRGHGETLAISVPTVRVDGRDFEVGGVELAGLGGKLYADGSRRGGKLTARLRTDGDALDLSRLARLVGEPHLAGELALDADVTSVGAEAEGDVRVALRDGRAPGLPHVHVVLDASLHARRGRVAIDAQLGQALTARTVVRELALAGPALSAESWLRANGSGFLFADVELARLHEALPEVTRALPVRLMGGRGRAQARFVHASEGRLPTVRVAVSTRGLAVAPNPAGEGAAEAGSSSWGLDLGAEALVDGVTGFTAISGRVTDARGPLVSLDGKGSLPLELLLAGAEKSALRAAMLDRPFGIHVAAPERKLSELQPIVDLKGTTGEASLDLSIEGTPRAPQGKLTLAGRNLRALGTGAPATLDATLRYEGKVAELDATIAASANASPSATPEGVRVEARAEVDLAHLAEGKPAGELPWRADLSARFDRFQLATLPSREGARVRGALDGEVTLRDLHRDATVDLALEGTSLTVAQAPIPHVALRAHSGGGAAKASLRVDQADGFAELVASAGLAWGAALAPKLDRAHPLDAHLTAKGFRAAALAPFTAQTLADLDGRVDAAAHVRADGGGKEVVAEGTVIARDFSFVVAAMGQEYRDVGARVTFAPGGVIRVEDLHASDGVGKIMGSAVARLDGLGFVGANVALRIPESSPIDLVLEGRTLGDAHGDIRVGVRNLRATKTLDVTVDIPSLHVKLLESAGKQVQELKARDDVRVGVVRDRQLIPLALAKPKPGPDEAAAAADDSVVHVAVNLGRDVVLRRGAMIAVQLTGSPRVGIAHGRTDVSGQLSLTSGKIDLSGRKFLVDSGTITFGQDATNPVVIATASWTAADKSRVFADFVGPVKTGKLTLRSEPARSQSEILTLIAFGSVDGPSDVSSGRGKSPGQGTQLATTVGGGALTQGFDAALDDVIGVQTQTRIDSTNANNPRPELEVQVSRDVSLRFAYVLGTPPPSAPDKSLGTVILRIAPNWSLSTTVGDKGKATVDTVWQYRY